MFPSPGHQSLKRGFGGRAWIASSVGQFIPKSDSLFKHSQDWKGFAISNSSRKTAVFNPWCQVSREGGCQPLHCLPSFQHSGSSEGRLTNQALWQYRNGPRCLTEISSVALNSNAHSLSTVQVENGARYADLEEGPDRRVRRPWSSWSLDSQWSYSGRQGNRGRSSEFKAKLEKYALRNINHSVFLLWNQGTTWSLGLEKSAFFLDHKWTKSTRPLAWEIGTDIPKYFIYKKKKSKVL